MSSDDPVEAARKHLFLRRTFRHGEKDLVVAYLIREDDWRPLDAPWWTGKEAYMIGSDLDGNFFLRHCDGSIRLWVHAEQRDEVIARSVKDFLYGLH